AAHEHQPQVVELLHAVRVRFEGLLLQGLHFRLVHFHVRAPQSLDFCNQPKLTSSPPPPTSISRRSSSSCTLSAFASRACCSRAFISVLFISMCALPNL